MAQRAVLPRTFSLLPRFAQNASISWCWDAPSQETQVGRLRRVALRQVVNKVAAGHLVDHQPRRRGVETRVQHALEDNDGQVNLEEFFLMMDGATSDLSGLVAKQVSSKAKAHDRNVAKKKRKKSLSARMFKTAEQELAAARPNLPHGRGLL